MQDKRIRNMDEFATVCGVSRPTLSKYFQDPASVRATTRHRIEAALDRYDFRPNVYAVNQNRGLTKTVGIVVPYLADPFFAEIARIIERRCIDAGFSPVLFSAHGVTAYEVDILDNLVALKPAGVLLAPLGRNSDRAALERFCARVPTVLFDSHVEGVGNAFIGSNNRQSIALIVNHLARTGQPPCFFEMASPVNPNARRRRAAYLEAMEDLGLTPCIVQAKATHWDFESIGHDEGGGALDAGAFATDTILCSNDRLAIGLLAAAFERGLPVGRAPGCVLRIAGHDDHPFARFTCPALTTVAQDYAAIAARSVETLFALIEAGGAAGPRQTVIFDGHLILRESA